VSELNKPSATIDESLARLDAYITHMKEHVSEVPVRTKKYDPNCKGCQMELNRIVKKSDNSPGVQLKSDPMASVNYITVLCYLKMHNECVQDYVMESELVKFRCTCECHKKPVKKRARVKATRH
jgi:hypothetical protein